MEELERIAQQAEYLARVARELRNLYRSFSDKGQIGTTYKDIEDAQRELSGAFMAVIRVTASYI